MNEHPLVNLAYLAASILFITGVKRLAHPRTAVSANSLSAVGMLIAVIAVLTTSGLSFGWVLFGLAAGSGIGLLMAYRVKMTGMPQMVALLNGFGGLASLLVGGGALLAATPAELASPLFRIATAASAFIGAVTFTGSLVAFAQLEEVGLKGRPVLLPNRHLLNASLAAVCFSLAFTLLRAPSGAIYWLLGLFALLLGVMLVIPIGGADMPVVIALLNSYSGMAACATGFVLQNSILIIAGALVGASGLILVRIMCRAMNRSMVNVIFGAMGAAASTPAAGGDVYEGRVKSAGPEELALVFDGARRVVFVPGYGMAVAQAHHAVRELAKLLESRGTEVAYAIHPVAGRMPGHMNILLAEAEIPYEALFEPDQINPTMPQSDVAVVIGANDTVNPLARTDPASPIAGMPIIDADKARTVVVIKRSLSPGFSGIPNPLFAAPNTLMFFADGKKAVLDIVSAIKEL